MNTSYKLKFQINTDPKGLDLSTKGSSADWKCERREQKIVTPHIFDMSGTTFCV